MAEMTLGHEVAVSSLGIPIFPSAFVRRGDVVLVPADGFDSLPAQEPGESDAAYLSRAARSGKVAVVVGTGEGE